MTRTTLTRRSFIAAASVLLLSSCASNSNSSSAQGQGSSSGKHVWAKDDQLHVAATFYPMADFSSKIGGSHAEVVCLVPAGTEPHDWEPSPDDMITLQTADLVVYNGLGMDAWLESALGSLGDKAPQSVCTTDAVNVLKTDEGTDPHAWLDPDIAAQQASAIAAAFASADPGNAEAYHNSLASFTKELNALTQEYASSLQPLPHHDIVVSHEAYGYLCRAFGLTQIGIEGLSPDSEPDAARMAQIVDLVKQKGVTTIFFEELVSPKVAETIASETGAAVEELSPLEGLTDEDLAAGKDYLVVMRENLDKLKKALA